MNKSILKILESYSSRELTAEEAEQAIRNLFQPPVSQPELPHFFRCENMNPAEVLKKLEDLQKIHHPFLATKAGEEIFHYVRMQMPEVFYYDAGHAIFGNPPKASELLTNRLVIITNRHYEERLVEEAYIAARMAGVESYRIKDIGMFGRHLTEQDKAILQSAEFLIIIGGPQDSTLDWIIHQYEIPSILVPVLKSEMAFIEQLNMLSSTLSYSHYALLRSSINGAAEAALIASYFLLKSLKSGKVSNE